MFAQIALFALFGNGVGPHPLGGNNPVGPNAQVLTPTFQVFRNGQMNSPLSSCGNIPTSVTLNGTETAVTAMWDFGKCAGGSCAGDTGPTLSEAGTGDAITYGVGSPLNGSLAVDMNGGVYLESSDSSLEITTEDFIWVIVFEGGSAQDEILGKADAVTMQGYQAFIDPVGNAVRFRVDDGPDQVNTDSPASVFLNEWGVAMLIHEAGVSQTAYLNGVAGTNSSLTTIGSLAGGAAFRVGFSTTNKYNERIACAALFKGTGSWLSGTTGWNNLALEMFQRITGTWPQVHVGSGLAITHDRNTPATLDRFVGSTRELFSVGDNWIRVVSKPSNTSGSGIMFGALSEALRVNKALQSNDLATSWSTVAASVNTNVAAMPTGLTTGDGIQGTAADVEHGVSQTITLNATQDWTFSAFCKPGAENWAYMDVSSLTNVSGYFDLANCAAGASGVNATPRVESGWVGGYCRISITYAGTAAGHLHRLMGAEGNSDRVYIGSGASDIVCGHVQVENIDYATSVIHTTTVTVSRANDSLVYDGSGGNVTDNKSGMASTYLLGYNYNDNTGRYPWVLSDGGESNEEINLLHSVGFTFFRGNEVSSQWSISDTTDITTGAGTHLEDRWETNDIISVIDKSVIGTDSSANITTAIDTIYIGSDDDDAFHWDGMVSEVALWDYCPQCVSVQNPNSPPNCTLNTLSGECDVSVGFSLADDESDTMSVTIQYKKGAGAWTNATITGSTTGLGVGSHSKTWNSNTDENCAASFTAQIRITPNDGTDNGTICTSNSWSVDNSGCSGCGGGDPGGGCFVAGTPINTPVGQVPIESLSVGDVVQSFDLSTGQIVAGEVLAVHQKDVGEIVRVGGVITTPEHPFWVEGRGWVGAGNLLPGDWLLQSDMGDLQIAGVDVVTVPPTRVYNLTVGGLANYYAGGLLVHNKCDPGACECGCCGESCCSCLD